MKEMSQQPSKLQMILMSQIAIILMSLVTTFFPQYYLVVIILYTIIILGLTSYSATRKSKASPEELKNPIFREQNAMKIAMLDKNLSKELMKQMKVTMMTFITLPLVFILFPLYRGNVEPIVSEALRSMLENESLATYLNFLIMYEIIFMVLNIVRIATMKKFKPINIMLPQQYIVYRAGVLANNKMFIRFSEEQCFNYNPKRHYVEILSPKNPGFKLRLYSDNIGRLRDKLLSEGIIRECKEDVSQ